MRTPVAGKLREFFLGNKVKMLKHKNRLKLNFTLPCVIILDFIFSQPVSSQEKQSFFSTLYLETTIHEGFLINHHPEMRVLTAGFFPSWEASLTKQTTGHNSAVYFRNYPRYGLTYRYNAFGGSPWLGEAHSMMSFINLQIGKTRLVNFDFRISLGLAYLTNKFDRLENYKNMAIGSNWNASIAFRVNSRIKISEITDFTVGISMLHLSNGTIKTPNYGLNIPAVEAGLNFKLNRDEIRYQIPDSLIFNKGKKNVRISFGMATKEILDHWEEDFLVYTGEIAFTGYYNNVNRYIIGFDATYDQANAIEIATQGDTTSAWVEESKFGVIAGHEWVFSRLAMNLSLGFYLYDLNNSDDPVYNKIGVIYFFSKNLFAGLSLKSHYAKADFLSGNIGLNF